MKKFTSVISVLLVFLLIAGCGMQTTGTAKKDDKKKDDQIVIGVSLLNLGNEFIVQIKNGIEKKAKELGVKVIINDAQKSADKQLQQVDSFIAQGVDAIVVNPVETEASSPAVEKAKAAGIPVINVNGVTTAEPDAFVGSKDEESAEIAIKFLAEKLNGKGNIVMMHGYPGQAAEIKRTDGAKNILKNYPDMKLIAEQTANWSRDEALSLMENWLQANKGKINAVFAQNDEMGMGALQALEKAGVKKDIVLISIDAIADALQAVKDGRLDATVFQNANGQGGGAIETALKIIKKEDYEKETYIPFELVTKENVDKYLK
ncbi:sugar ABC transporter substrate-binding protein [Neobacillus dielmonensis]|uniref:sugar ABC transporter substrate-binding protein n=1 Tax=Neobacillus dielmonensis TaxID=1347369 RepID=UPI0005AA0C8C|nr:sugar ABC transporter substrate-binding protein [Neobacillus dielmonensis]